MMVPESGSAKGPGIEATSIQGEDFRMVEWVHHLPLELVTSPSFLIVSFFLLFAIIVKRARDQKQKNARTKREHLKRRIYPPLLDGFPALRMRRALIWSLPVIAAFSLAVALAGLAYGWKQTETIDLAWFKNGLFWVTQTIGILPPGKDGFDTEMKKTGRVSNCRQPPCGALLQSRCKF
jgi:hypothetical protein